MKVEQTSCHGDCCFTCTCFMIEMTLFKYSLCQCWGSGSVDARLHGARIVFAYVIAAAWMSFLRFFNFSRRDELTRTKVRVALRKHRLLGQRVDGEPYTKT